MSNRWSPRFLLLVGLVVLVGWEVAHADAVPAGAVKAAQGYVDFTAKKAKEDPQYFERVWFGAAKGDVSDMRLGNPYQIYMMSRDSVVAYAESRELDPEKYLDFLHWAFPAFVSGEYVGTIKVAFMDGEWKYAGKRGGPPENKLDPWILSVREEYTEDKGYSVTVLQTRGMGKYVLLYLNGKLVNIAPAVVYQGSPFPAPEKGEYKFLSSEHALVGLKTSAVELKSAMESGARP